MSHTLSIYSFPSLSWRTYTAQLLCCSTTMDTIVGPSVMRSTVRVASLSSVVVCEAMTSWSVSTAIYRSGVCSTDRTPT